MILDGLKLYKATRRLEKKSRGLSPQELNEITEIASQEREQASNSPKKESIPDLIKHGKKIGGSALQMIIALFIMYVFVQFFIFVPMSLSNEFQQDMIKIAPYVEEHEVMQLKSDWACMRSKAEYTEIYDRIDAVKKEHNLP